MKNILFKTSLTLWASLDLPTFAGMLVFSSGLVLAAYIWKKWGQ